MANKFNKAYTKLKTCKYVGKHLKSSSGWELKFMRMLDTHQIYWHGLVKVHQHSIEIPATGKKYPLCTRLFYSIRRQRQK